MTEQLEDAILSALIRSEGKGFPSHNLTPDLFTGSRKAIFKHMADQHASKGGFDVFTIGIASGLHSMVTGISNVFSGENQIAHYVSQIRQARLEHEVSEVREWASREIKAGADILAVSTQAAAKLDAINQRWGEYVERNELAEAFNIVLSGIANRAPAEAILFGFNPVDSLTDGLIGGDYVILAARPSCGKTAFVLNLLVALAKARIKSTLFSNEMSAKALAGRILAQEAETPTRTAIRRPDAIPESQAEHFLSVAPQVEDIARYLNVVSTIGNTWGAIQRRAAHAIKTGSKLIACDYLQLLDGDDKSESRNNEIGKISRGWKALLRQGGIPGIMLSQLSRKCEEERRTPTLSDLRDSGSIEQDADVVWFLSNNYPKNRNQQPDLSKVVLIQAKGRDHGVGYRNLFFKREIQKFYEEQNG